VPYGGGVNSSVTVAERTLPAPPKAAAKKKAKAKKKKKRKAKAKRKKKAKQKRTQLAASRVKMVEKTEDKKRLWMIVAGVVAALVALALLTSR
jgi:hypothetical protein